jgi:cytochrome c-type biogenesis protein CcmH/NrfF
MSPLWLVPGGVVLVGGAVIVASLRHTAEEAKLLADEIARQRDVGVAARHLRESVRDAPRPALRRR